MAFSQPNSLTVSQAKRTHGASALLFRFFPIWAIDRCPHFVADLAVHVASVDGLGQSLFARLEGYCLGNPQRDVSQFRYRREQISVRIEPCRRGGSQGGR